MDKHRLAMGVSHYIKDNLTRQIPDVMSRRIMSGIGDVLLMKPEIIEKLMEKYPILEMFEEEGEYDTDMMENVLRKNIQEYGNITIELMGAKLTFSESDVSDIARVFANL